MDSKYTRPTCDCGATLNLTQRVVRLIQYLVEKNGSVGMGFITEEPAREPQWECSECNKVYTAYENKNGQVQKGPEVECSNMM